MFLKRFRLLVAAGSLLAAMSAPAVASAEPMKELNFGIISTESNMALKDSFAPFLNDMSKRLGVKVNAFFASDYAGIIEAMRFKKVDVAWYGNKGAIEAIDRANAEVFAQTTDADGNPGYWSLLIVHKDSPLQSLDDLVKSPGKYTFGNGDPNSTSGFVVPGYYVFAVNKIDPRKHFTAVRNANHETNALAVANKQVDVATCNTESLDRLKQRMPDKLALLRVIWKSPLIPSDPICWRKDLPEEMKTKIRAFFLDYGVKGPDAERERGVLKTVQNWGPFKPSDNRQVNPIRQLELFKEKSKVEADAAMSPADKAKKIASIDERLAAIEKEMKKN